MNRQLLHVFDVALPGTLIRVLIVPTVAKSDHNGIGANLVTDDARVSATICIRLHSRAQGPLHLKSGNSGHNLILFLSLLNAGRDCGPTDMGPFLKFQASKKSRILKRSRRRSLSAGDLTDAELAQIARAEIPKAERYSLKDRSTRKRRSGP